MLDTDQLRSFLAIVDTGSFRRAGDRVNKTQSAVSMHIRRLEERLDCALFVRNGRGVGLSEDGEKLLDYARQMLFIEASALAAVSAKGLRGRVRLGIPDDYTAPYLAEILSRFSAAHPFVEVSVVCEPTFMLAGRIQNRDLDVAIVTDCSKVSGAEILCETPLRWVAGVHARIDLSKPTQLALGSSVCDWRRGALAALEQAGIEYRILLTSNNYAAIEPVVRAGLGLTVFPQGDLRDGLRYVSPNEGFPSLEPCRIGLLRGASEQPREADAFAAEIRAVVRGVSGTETLASLSNPLPAPKGRTATRSRRAAIGIEV